MTNGPIPRKHPQRQMEDGLADGQTLFHRTFPATAGGPITVVNAAQY